MYLSLPCYCVRSNCDQQGNTFISKIEKGLNAHMSTECEIFIAKELEMGSHLIWHHGNKSNHHNSSIKNLSPLVLLARNGSFSWRAPPIWLKVWVRHDYMLDLYLVIIYSTSHLMQHIPTKKDIAPFVEMLVRGLFGQVVICICRRISQTWL